MDKLEFLKEMQANLQNSIDFHANALQSQKERLDAVNALMEEIAGKGNNNQSLQ